MLAAVLVGSVAKAQGVYYSPESILRVVDDHDNPVAEAIVLVDWRVGGNQPGSELEVFEGVTNAAGRLKIPAWGPRLSSRALDSTQPHLRVFKVGYVPIVEQSENPPAWGGRAGIMVQMTWVEKPIVLRKVEFGDPDYKNMLLVLSTSLYFYTSDQTCVVEKAHLMLDAVNSEFERFIPEYRARGQMSVEGWTYRDPNRAGCRKSSSQEH
jgi:hypothetical protein